MKVTLSFSAFLLSLFPIGVQAATFSNPLLSSDIIHILKGFILSVIYVSTPAVVVLIVWTGFLFVSARGNPKLLEKAKKQMIVSVIFTTIILSLWALILLIGNTITGLSSAGVLLIIGIFVAYVVVKK